MSDWKTVLIYEDMQILVDRIKIKYRCEQGLVIAGIESEVIEDYYESQLSAGDLYKANKKAIDESVGAAIAPNIDRLSEFPALLNISAAEFHQAMKQGGQ